MKGSLDFILETVEQVAWLASALRPSPYPEGVATCFPSVADIHVSKGNGSQSSGSILAASCSIQFVFELAPDPLDTAATLPGFCWSNMFRNPILVTGYPIPQRQVPETGLDISLGFMALLVDSDTIFRVGERLILKGFCSLLVAVEATKDLIIWHLLFNPSGERISFCDARIAGLSGIATSDISLKDLESRRHIVGWCRDVKEYSGKRRPLLRFSIIILTHKSRSPQCKLGHSAI